MWDGYWGDSAFMLERLRGFVRLKSSELGSLDEFLGDFLSLHLKVSFCFLLIM